MTNKKILSAKYLILLCITLFSFSTSYSQGYDYSDLNGDFSRISHLIQNKPNLYLRVPPDADDITSWESLDADDDDLSNTSDELTYSILPDLNEGDLLCHLSPKCTNNTGEEAILAMWLDVDGNGMFEEDEIAIAIVPDGSNDTEISIVFRTNTPYLEGSLAIGVDMRVAMRLTLAPKDGFTYDGLEDKQYTNGESEDCYLIISPKCFRVSKEKWFFGKNAGLDFSEVIHGEASLPTLILGQTESNEGTGAITTHGGKITTYTDGDNLWRMDEDKVHYTAKDESGVDYQLGGNSSSAQGALFAKAPQRNDYYYIFTNPKQGGGSAFFSVLDLSKSEGIGAAAVGTLIDNGTNVKDCTLNGGSTSLYKIPVGGSAGMSEMITGVENSDRSLVWIILHGESPDNNFYVARIDIDGLTWSVQPMNFEATMFASMRLSPDGRTLVVCHARDIVMYDFDPVDGIISNERYLASNSSANDPLIEISSKDIDMSNMSPIPNFSTSLYKSTTDESQSVSISNGDGDDHVFYSLEFSISSKTLYVSAFGNNSTSNAQDEPGYIYQFNMEDNADPILHSVFCILNVKNSTGGTEWRYGVCTIQRGVDYKLYFTDPGNYNIGCILEPDSLGIACDIDPNAISMVVTDNIIKTDTGNVTKDNVYNLLGLPNSLSNVDVIQCGSYDFSDNPVSYGEASHYSQAIDILYLGLWCDAEGNSNPFPAAERNGMNDDFDGNDDEDLDYYFPPLVDGMTEYVFWVPVASDNVEFAVSGWIDFNKDDTFDISERCIVEIDLTNFNDNSVYNGNHEVKLSWTLPAGFEEGNYYSRFRLATNRSQIEDPTGVASDGEVEDHIMEVLSPSYYIITFDVNGGLGVSNPPNGYSYQEAYLPDSLGNIPPRPSRDGYLFSCWEFDGVDFLNNDFNINPRSTYAYVNDIDARIGQTNAYTMPSSNVTLIAIWELDTDNDGIPNTDDLDDDNDGILDTDEQVTSVSSNDIDGDGINNDLDTDSDGDGCSDADEAYGDIDTDLDNNGMYGSGEPDVYSNGKVISASYTYSNLAGAYNATAESVCEAAPRDYGDAPDSYLTLKASDGASHYALSYNETDHTAELSLGDYLDIESNASLLSLTGVEDDNDGFDDEDGVTFEADLLITRDNFTMPVSYNNLTGGTVYISGFIDFDRNGTFDEDELSTAAADMSSGIVTLNWQGFNSIEDIDYGLTYARFRIASDLSEIEAANGLASDGEVEDYAVTIAGVLMYEDGVDNDSIVMPASYSYHYDSLVSIGSTVPERPNFKFVEWKNVGNAYSDDNGTVVIPSDATYQPGDIDAFTMPREHVTLTAQWESTIELETEYVDSITSKSAVMHGYVKHADSVLAYGFVYSYSLNDATLLVHGGADVDSILTVLNVPVDSSQIAHYSDTLTTLISRTNCYFRSFIRTHKGVYHYGEVQRFISQYRDFSLYLDGKKDFLVADKISTFKTINYWGANSAFSLDFWIKRDGSDMCICDCSGNGSGYRVFVNNDNRIVLRNDKNVGIMVAKSSSVIDTEWHHVAITHEQQLIAGNSVAHVYIDGQDVTEDGANNLTVCDNTINFTLGVQRNVSSQVLNKYFEGNIDEFRVWNVVLTQAQIRDLAYDKIEKNTSDGVSLLGSGKNIDGLLWDNLNAVFSFDTKSMTENVNTSTDITFTYNNQDEGWDYPFFNENSDLNSSNNPQASKPKSFNLLAVGDAKPSVCLPRVNWTAEASTEDWLFSDNWSGRAYNGQGIESSELSTYSDVTTIPINDASENCDYTIVNESTTNHPATISGDSPPEVNYLIDNDTLNLHTYKVDYNDTDSLIISKGIRGVLFDSTVVNFEATKIVIDGGSMEVQ